MIDKFLTKVFGSSNQRYLKTIQPIIERINSLEAEVKQLSDEDLRARNSSSESFWTVGSSSLIRTMMGRMVFR